MRMTKLKGWVKKIRAIFCGSLPAWLFCALWKRSPQWLSAKTRAPSFHKKTAVLPYSRSWRMFCSTHNTFFFHLLPPTFSSFLPVEPSIEQKYKWQAAAALALHGRRSPVAAIGQRKKASPTLLAEQEDHPFKKWSEKAKFVTNRPTDCKNCLPARSSHVIFVIFSLQPHARTSSSWLFGGQLSRILLLLPRAHKFTRTHIHTRVLSEPFISILQPFILRIIWDDKKWPTPPPEAVEEKPVRWLLLSFSLLSPGFYSWIIARI